MEEIWKDITGYEGLYQVSNFSRIRSLDRTVKVSNPTRFRFFKGQIVNPVKLPIGYLVVTLSNIRKNRRVLYVHRLVATEFIDNPNRYEVINHIDGDPTNNSLSNLEWCTQRENVGHFFKSRNKTSPYVGVSYNTKEKRWCTQLRVNGKPVWIGSFKNEQDAIKAHQKCMIENNVTSKYVMP